MRLNPDVLDRPYYSLALRPADAAVRVARELLKAALAEWDASHLADDAALVASELVTNAVRCARSVVMTVRAGDAGRITLEVWDDSPEPPVPRGDDPTGGCGRGSSSSRRSRTCGGGGPPTAASASGPSSEHTAPSERSERSEPTGGKARVRSGSRRPGGRRPWR
ncbi:ATP-binding protein [Actinomadura sp. J1-007]|uniref:ATP-binding protein n=1 Tax=Actinomadura sp. J1-007 TaxID=2661913 RepID=UPI001582CA38|nr:ATP-binding protein [Actinomadura sp. J1-007]